MHILIYTIKKIYLDKHYEKIIKISPIVLLLLSALQLTALQ